MKKLMVSAVAIASVILSCGAFANKVVISGEPVVIEKRGDYYYVPDTYQPMADYYYVTVEGTNKVCYKSKQPNLTLSPTTLNVEVKGSRTMWNCYDYDTNYFVVQP